MMMMMKLVLLMALAVAAMPLQARAIDVHQLRQVAAQNNITCFLVFGDSSVDPGNNNRLSTSFKGNFPPYGKDFFNGRPTGRFSNGRLTTDFIAEALGYKKVLPAFLDRNLKKEDLLHGVSFASAASGYDDLTANLTNVLPISRQLDYLKHYMIQLRRMVGEKKENEIIRNAIFLLSMGTNDFIQNYYVEPTRSKQYTVEQYEDYLIKCLVDHIKAMHKLGATRLIVVAIPPLGCMPLVKTIMGTTGCVDSYNKIAFSFNTKAKDALASVRTSLGMKTAFVDIYATLESVMNNPIKYGITVTSKGCCGTGTIEYGDTCRGLSTCANPKKYVFWDAVHPTEEMYKIIAVDAISSLDENIFT